jgi:hypothetical protein
MPETRATPKPGQVGPMAWIGQVLLYGAFALAIGVFSRWPTYHPIAPGQALIKLSFTRVGKPVGDCRKPSAEEQAKLPPNMRAPEICPRERSPITVQVDVDGQRALERVAAPTGLSKDGAAAVYERLLVPAGERRIAVSLSDDVRARATPYVREAKVPLAPGQVLVIDFDTEKGGITFR